MKRAKGRSGEHLEATGLGESRWNRNRFWISQPFFEIERRGVRSLQFEWEDFTPSERIDTQNTQVFPGSVGEGHNALDDGGGGFYPGKRSYRGQQAVVESATNLQMGSPGGELCRRLKAGDGPAICDLNGQKDGNTEGDPQDV